MLQYFEVIGKDEIICVHTKLPLTAEELSDMFKKDFKQCDPYTYKQWKKKKENQAENI